MNEVWLSTVWDSIMQGTVMVSSIPISTPKTLILSLHLFPTLPLLSFSSLFSLKEAVTTSLLSISPYPPPFLPPSFFFSSPLSLFPERGHDLDIKQSPPLSPYMEVVPGAVACPLPAVLISSVYTVQSQASFCLC